MDWRAWVRRAWGAVGRAQGAWPAAPVALAGGSTARVTQRLAPLDDDERATVRALLDEAPGPRHRAALEAALAAGHGPGTLGRFADLLAGAAEDALDATLDPLRHRLRQRSQTTCGSACLLVARALTDPVYATWLLTGLDARTAAAGESPVTERFAAAEQAVKDRTNGVVGAGRPQWPWPKRLGTPPWGAANEMTRVTGRRHRARYVGPDSAAARRAAYEAVDRVVGAGGTAPLFVGNEAAPRHVVLAVGRTPDALTCYEPASGDVVRLGRDAWVAGGFRIAGWTVPWAVVVPR